jgi:DNA-binding CsgD family transcriptional regulator
MTIDADEIVRLARIATARYRRHPWADEIQQEVAVYLWSQHKRRDYERAGLVWLGRLYAHRAANNILGDPRSKRGRRALEESTFNTHDFSWGLPPIEDVQTISVSDQFGLTGQQAVCADMLAAGAEKKEVAVRLGCSAAQVTRICKAVARRVAAVNA